MDKDLRPRAARYSFVADVTLTELESGSQSKEQTWDLSLFGCHVVPGNSPKGTRVRIQIFHDGEVFEAQGTVMNSRPITGVGIVFIKVEERHQLTLDKWIGALRDRNSRDQVHGRDSHGKRIHAGKAYSVQ